jgi:hypothetical protein
MWMEKYCEQFQNNIYKKIMNEDKPVWELKKLNQLSGLFWAFVGFIVHILIHFPVGIAPAPIRLPNKFMNFQPTKVRLNYIFFHQPSHD